MSDLPTNAGEAMADYRPEILPLHRSRAQIRFARLTLGTLVFITVEGAGLAVALLMGGPLDLMGGPGQPSVAWGIGLGLTFLAFGIFLGFMARHAYFAGLSKRPYLELRADDLVLVD